MHTLISERQIREGVARLAAEIDADYHGRPLTVLGVLTGSIIFLSDLVRCLNQPLRVGLIQASSYRGPTTTPGELTINTALLPQVAGRDVLLLDDIYDTGQTLARLLRELVQFEPRSVRSAVLLWKEGRQTVDVVPDYHGFKIPNVFVVGYGLDFNDEFRNLRHIARLDAAPGAPANSVPE